MLRVIAILCVFFMKVIYLDQTQFHHRPDALPASQPTSQPAQSTANKIAPQLSTACVLTIGNFDGVHLGHQAMLNKTIELAGEQQLASAVMIFEPQPREYFTPSTAPARLSNLTEKQQLIAAQGIDVLIVARFDAAFRSLSAQAFATLLSEQLQVQQLVLGDDFRFGHDRAGDSDFLRKAGLPVTNLHTITDHSHADERISSTRIRELLAAGELTAANKLLGYDYQMIGRVINGNKIGRTLDFPTANVCLQRLRPALHGVFGVDVVMLDDAGRVVTDAWQQGTAKQGVTGLRPHSLFGTANIGTRPSVHKAHDWRLEVHFPAFIGDLYGKRLQVRFLHYLHGERHYPNLGALKAGIAQDVADLLRWRRQQDEPTDNSQSS